VNDSEDNLAANSEPSPSGETPTPFAPPAKSGCGKPLLLMAGAVAILLLVALVVFAFKAGSLLALTFRSVAPAVIERLADEVSEGERARLVEAFEAAAQQAESGDLNPEKLALVQRQFGAVASGGEISGEQVAALCSALEALAGIESPVSVEPPTETQELEEASPGPPPANEEPPSSAPPFDAAA